MPQSRPDIAELIARSGIPMPAAVRIHRAVASKSQDTLILDELLKVELTPLP